MRNELSEIKLQSHTSLKTTTEALYQRIESLTQRFSDRAVSLKSEITIELSQRKSEV